jgi:hypothetical protein
MNAPHVEQLKQLQRQDATAKEQWHAYCAAYGNNIRDPAKHDEVFINSFITQYNAGARLQWQEGEEFIKMIKLGQRRSQAWKAVWEMYANQKPIDGKPKHDPAQHSAEFLEGFYEFIGNMAIGNAGIALAGGMPGSAPSGGMGGYAMGGFGEPPQKRAKMGGDDPLVQRIKNYQRMGQAQKDAWHTYADSVLNGMRDPARNESSALEQFCIQYGVP